MNRDHNATPDAIAIDIVSRMGVIDDATCVELLESTPVGRVGFVVDGSPIVLPVNYAWFDGSIVFRTLDGQKLAAAAQAQDVCFEVDDWDAAKRTGWSVLVRGAAREVTEWAEREQLERIGLVPWAREEWRPMWVCIEANEITGRILR